MDIISSKERFLQKLITSEKKVQNDKIRKNIQGQKLNLIIFVELAIYMARGNGRKIVDIINHKSPDRHIMGFAQIALHLSTNVA